MIKDSLKSIANKVMTGVKHATLEHTLNTIGESSPYLANAAANKLNSLRAAAMDRALAIDEFMTSESSDAIRETILKNNPKADTNKEADKLLKEIEKYIKKNGTDAAKANEKYSKLIESYTKFQETVNKRSAENKAKPESAENNPDILSNNRPQNPIERILTEKTAAILDRIIPSGKTAAEKTKTDEILSEQLDEQKKTNEFLQRMVDDDSTDEVRDAESSLEALRRTVPMDISSSALAVSRSHSSDIQPQSRSELTIPDIIIPNRIKRLPGPARLPSKVLDAAAAADYLPGKQNKPESFAGKAAKSGIGTVTDEALSKRPRPDVTDVDPKSKAKPSMLSRVSSILASPAARIAGGIAAVGAAGYAGYKAGEWINDKFLTAADGSNKIGSAVYDFLNPSQQSVMPARVDRTKAIGEVSKKMEFVENKKQANMPPVVIAPQTQQITQGGSNKIIVPTNVRNKESTFERVQMQDYWPRAA